MWPLIYSFLNLFWCSKIRLSGHFKWYFENIKYIMWYIKNIMIFWNIMIISIFWYFWKYHDIFTLCLLQTSTTLWNCNQRTSSRSLYVVNYRYRYILKISILIRTIRYIDIETIYHDIRYIDPYHYCGIDLSNEPRTKAVQSTVWLQLVWLICVTHTSTHITMRLPLLTSQR